MVPAWTVTVSYLGYAVMLAIGTGVWLAALFDTVVYDRVEMGRLGQGWLDFSHILMRGMKAAVWAAVACAVVAFVLAALPAGGATPVDPDVAPDVTPDVTGAHKAYQLRCGAIALAFLVLVGLARVRMGAFDADAGAVVLFAWALWVVAAGWFAYAGGMPVTGPALWWLALAADLLLVGVFALFWIMIEIQGFRMF
ncbi:hypothetical protein [Pelagibius sp. 7325]|uniref:hypothetical protein n=1 Tax=Pelagibius sp. 7325 TaxID=3131994 RepID=UPI0030EBFA94